MRKNKSLERLGEESVLKLLIKFSVPSIIGMFVIALYNVVDRIFVGQGLGGDGIGAIAIVFPVQMFFIGVSMLIGIGGNAIFSIKLGEKKREEAENIFGNAVVLLIVPSLIVSIIFLIFIDELLMLLGVTDQFYQLAKDYLFIILIGTVFSAASPGLNHFIRSDGHPKTSMFTQLLGAILNIILDPIFIFVLDLGIKGAALATIISQFVTFVWVMGYFISPISKITIHMRNLKLRWHLIKSMTAVGFAPFIMQIIGVLLMTSVNHQLGKYGSELYITAFGIVLSISNLCIMPVIGINQGAQSILGYNYGAKKYDRVIRCYIYGVIFSVAVSFVGFVLVEFIPEYIVMIFNKTDEQLISVTSKILRVVSLMLPLVGFQVFSSNFFQALGKAKQAVFLSTSRQLLILYPLMYIIPIFFGVIGLCFAYPISDFISSILTLCFVIYEIKKLKKMEHNV